MNVSPLEEIDHPVPNAPVAAPDCGSVAAQATVSDAPPRKFTVTDMPTMAAPSVMNRLMPGTTSTVVRSVVMIAAFADWNENSP